MLQVKRQDGDVHRRRKMREGCKEGERERGREKEGERERERELCSLVMSFRMLHKHVIVLHIL